MKYLQTAQDQEEDDSDELDDMLGGPKVIILEQMRHNMEEISRIGTCYLGDIPPSPFVYFNDSYDSNGLDVIKHSTLIFLSPKKYLQIIFFLLML